MIASLIITFRETLEAVLITGIIISYLNRIGRKEMKTYVWLGVLIGISFSIIGAFIFNLLLGGFIGRSEQMFEGFLMILGSLLITSMIFWMMKQSNIVNNLEKKIETNINVKSDKIQKLGVFSIVFIAILREGIEIVIFLGTTSFISAENSLIGAILGIVSALILGYMVYIGAMNVNLKNLFSITGIFLVFLAAGLFAYGIHELQEANIIPIFIEHIYDINSFIDEKGTFGSILKGLFGYNGNPSLVETTVYWLYLIFALIFWKLKFLHIKKK
ncbi:FTR1 family iron permease [Candidatus Harpocratesius sp.]